MKIEKFGDWMEFHRRKRGWSMEYLARESDLASRTLFRLAAGADPKLETASAIAAALGEKYVLG